MSRRMSYRSLTTTTLVLLAVTSGLPAAGAEERPSTSANSRSAAGDPSPGSAMNAAPATADARTEGDQSSGVAEVIVTAQKRAENVQDVPISVAVLDASMLAQAHITAVADLPKLTPGFNVSRGQQVASIGLRIRGVGAAGSTATEPSVATFIDGVYVPRPGALFASFLDIDGVEVLRGPQGTLFGRNASVGAVSLRTALPGDTFKGTLNAETGTAGRYKVDGAVDLPINERASLRLAGLGQWFDGYWHNRLDGRDFGSQNNQAFRATLKLAPSSNLTWLMRGDYSHLTGDGFPMEDLLPETVPATRLATLQARLGGALPDLNPYDRTANEFVDARLVDRQGSVSSDVWLDLESGYSLRLIDSYREWRNDQHDADVTFMPIPIFARDGNFRSRSHSHELQILSPTDRLLGGRLDYVGGLYYFSETFDIGERLSLFDNLCRLLGPLGTACRAGPLTNATTLAFNQTVDSYAAYAQANYALLDNLSLTLGARYTKDDKDGTFVQLAPNSAAAIAIRAPENVPLHLDGSKPTVRAAVSWNLTPEQMLFASFSTGYKSGGFNSGGGNLALGQSRIFGPEKVDDYEVGAKTSWLQRMLQVNVTLFSMDIRGFQDRAVNGTSFIVRNAGDLRQRGAEFDATLAPARGVSLNVSAAYLDSSFISFIGAPNLPGLPGSQNLTGASATFSPRWSGSTSAQYEGALRGNWSWSIRGDLSFVSRENIGQVTDNNSQVLESGYSLLGARLSINGPDNRWTLAAFGDNLTDKHYCTQRQYQTIDTAFGLRGVGETATRCFLGDPRTYGVAVGMRF